ncbi:MAG: hypothetical protein OEZ36_05925, partial [Spirochaetota bacterium]|nr:hypothetical protein [Spirochaetota bacterium]
MKNKLRVGLAQVNPTIGDISGNCKIVTDCLAGQSHQEIDIMAFPEMVITGYPAQDLLFREEIIEANLEAIDRIKDYTKDYMAVIVGYCQPAVDKSLWRIDRQHLYNAYALFSYGELVDWGAKSCLPCYGVFDDYRYFIPYNDKKIHEIDGIRLGVEICEDLWYQNHEQHPIYPIKPTKDLAEKGADIIVVINASPYYLDRELQRESLLRE